MDGSYNPDAFLDFSQYSTGNSSNSPSPAFGATPYVFGGENRPVSPFFTPPFIGFQDSPFFSTVGATTFSNAPSLTSPQVVVPSFAPHSAVHGDTSSPPHVTTPSPPHISSATPSPPLSSSSTLLTPPNKRKRTTKEDLMKVNASIMWDSYTPPDTQCIQLLDNLVPIEDLSFHVGHIDKNAIVEPEKCIIYRQNQFKLQCNFGGVLQRYSTPPSRDLSFVGGHIVAMIDNRLHEVDGLYLKLYAFKQTGDETTEEFKVPIHQVGPSRTKKETKPPEIMPIVTGAVLFDKLQFQASTHVGSECYFRIVIALMARIHDKYYMVSAMISPRLLVRAQNPGRYNPAAQNTKASGSVGHVPIAPLVSSTNNSPETDHSQEENDEKIVPHPLPPKLENPYAPSPWVKDGRAVHYYGKVGINTSTPQESLTVNGNVLVTGDICKPSDRRLKRNFEEVSPASQLNVINKINIYDYDVMSTEGHRRERGVIAQELAQVMPSAVHRIGSYTLQDGRVVDNLLVVNERMLLMENIGATQYLDQVVQMERAEIDFVNMKVEELEQEEQENSSYVMKTIQNMGSLLMSEDFKETANSGWIYCGFSICGLGPAWSMFLIGFFFFPAWFLGGLYVTSRNPIKRAAGLANVMMLCVSVFVIGCLLVYPSAKTSWQTLICIVLVFGVMFVTTIACYKRRRERLREKVLKNNLKNDLRNIHLTPGYRKAPPEVRDQFRTEVKGRPVNKAKESREPLRENMAPLGESNPREKAMSQAKML